MNLSISEAVESTVLLNDHLHCSGLFVHVTCRFAGAVRPFREQLLDADHNRLAWRSVVSLA